MIKLKPFISSNNFSDDENKEFDLDDQDNPDAWKWTEIDMCEEMGFSKSGGSRLNLKVDTGKKSTPVSIYKNNLGYTLQIEDRKFVFKRFKDMIKKIDELGEIKI